MNQDDLKYIYRKNLINKINWKPHTEKPKDGEEIWVLEHHCKGHFPSSFRITAGEVESFNDKTWRVNTCDYDGAGGSCTYPGDYCGGGFFFWCNKWEISVPEEIISWDHDSGVD